MKITNYLFLFTIIFFFKQFITAQDYSHEFGVITDYEKEMKTYDKDTTAEAVVIYDIGESSFYSTSKEININYKRRTKIKVLKESYINNAEFYFFLYKKNRKNEGITEFEANTYNIDKGELIKTSLNIEYLYKEAINEYWDKVIFAMPNIKVGSIIEYKYQTITPSSSNIKDWLFQASIPTIHSEYTAKMIPFYEYKIRLQGATKLDKTNIYEEDGPFLFIWDVPYKDHIYQYIMKDIPAFKDESFMSSPLNYIIKLDFQLSKINKHGGGTTEILSSWESLIKKLEKGKVYGLYIFNSKNNFKKIATKNNLSAKNGIDRTDYIINYLKTNFIWNGLNNMNTSKTLKSFLKEKTGNSAQFNLYLIGALKAVDIEVYPVIISTRGNGKIVREYPFLKPFNYVLAYANIDNTWKLLDATDIFCPNDKIPEDCINDIGLVINKAEIKWIRVTRQDVSIIQNSIQSQVSSDLDSLNGSFTISSNGYSAMKLRKQFKNKTEDIEEYISSDNYEITSPVTTENYDDVDKDYIMKYDISCLSDNIQNKILIHPFFHDPMQDNPFKEQSRKYPIDMVYPKSTTYTNEIKLPDNCMVEKLPDNFFFNNDLFLLQYTASEKNGLINVKAAYQFKKSIYEPEEYSDIKSYYDMIIKYFNQTIVLSEKTK